MFVGYTSVAIEGINVAMTGEKLHAIIERRNGTRLEFHSASLKDHMLSPEQLTRLDPSPKVRVPTWFGKMFGVHELAHRMVMVGYLDIEYEMKKVHKFNPSSVRRMACRKMGSVIKEVRENLQDVESKPQVHMKLMKDLPEHRIRRKEDRLLLPLCKSIILGPFQIKKAVLPYNFPGSGIHAFDHEAITQCFGECIL